MRLGIDLDGVVAQFHKGWMERHAAEFGSDLRPDMVDRWDGLAELAGFADAHEFWTWFRNGDGPSSFRHLEPYPDALPTIRRFVDAGHDIVILTHKFTWAVSDTFAWLSDVDMPTKEVHILGDKHRVECDVYLDDSPFVLPALAVHRPDALICRFVRGWNTPVVGAIDINSWAEFEAAVNDHANR